METMTALQQLACGFCHANDNRDPDWLGRCFTKDCSHLGADGREAIVAMFESVWARQEVRRRHVLTNFVLKEDNGDQALLLAYELLYLIKGNRTELLLSGLYEMDAVIEDGEWRIRKLGILLDVPYDPGDVPTLTTEVDENGRHRLIPA